MIFTRLALLACLATTAFAADGEYFYDPSHSLGPANWGNVAIEGNQCNGSKNSPIAVATAMCDEFQNYKLTPGTCTIADMDFVIADNGVKASYKDGCVKNTVEIPGIDGVYEALQFHVHTSSEHTIDGRFYGAELHVVHKSTTEDRYAVVGMMIDPSAPTDNEIFEQYLASWRNAALATSELCGDDIDIIALYQQEKANERRLQSQDAVVNVYDLLHPTKTTFYHYDGGLTTPPCSEVVWWNLADHPVSISVQQFTTMTTLMMQYRDEECLAKTRASPAGSTSRPVQPLNDRIVKRICPAAYDDLTPRLYKGDVQEGEEDDVQEGEEDDAAEEIVLLEPTDDLAFLAEQGAELIEEQAESYDEEEEQEAEAKPAPAPQPVSEPQSAEPETESEEPEPLEDVDVEDETAASSSASYTSYAVAIAVGLVGLLA